MAGGLGKSRERADERIYLMPHVGPVRFYAQDEEVGIVDEAKQHPGLVDNIFLTNSWNHVLTRGTQPTG